MDTEKKDQSNTELEIIRQDLGEEYTDIRELKNGRGGLGNLYRARHVRLDVDVVIKCIRHEFIENIDQKLEANILKNLKHQYLPKVYDIIPGQNGAIYTIMEFIPGISMERYVRENGTVSQAQALRWSHQLTEVTSYLHEQDPPIIHCDIKPGNIMITNENDICLIDFNTSLFFKKGAASIGATPGYAAPEQYQGYFQADEDIPDTSGDTVALKNEKTELLSDVQETADRETENKEKADTEDKGVRNGGNTGKQGKNSDVGIKEADGISTRTDVYAIGASLYYLICGYSPQVAFQDVTPISAFHPSVSITLQKIIEKAMQKNPAKRYADAGEMMKAIDGVKRTDLGRRIRRVVLAAAVIGMIVLGYGLYQKNIYDKRPDVILQRELDAGRLCMAQNREREAIEHYLSALEVDEENSEAKELLGTYYMTKADEYSREDMHENAFRMLELAELYLPYSYDYKKERAAVYQEMASEMIIKEQYEDAVQCLDSAYQETKEDSFLEQEIEVYIRIAEKVADEKGDLEAGDYLCGIGDKTIARSEGILDRAADYYCAVADAYLSEKKYEEAEALVKKGLDKTRDPRFLSLSDAISGERDKIQKRKDAEEACKRILEVQEEGKLIDVLKQVQEEGSVFILLCDAYEGRYCDAQKGFGVYYVEGEKKARIYMLYIGQFDGEMRDGEGEWYSITGSTMYYAKGNWEKDWPNGYQESNVYYTDNRVNSISGEVVNGLWNGDLTFKSGYRTYRGSAENGFIKLIRTYGNQRIFGENGNGYYYTTDKNFFEDKRGILGFCDDVD